MSVTVTHHVGNWITSASGNGANVARATASGTVAVGHASSAAVRRRASLSGGKCRRGLFNAVHLREGTRGREQGETRYRVVNGRGVKTRGRIIL